MHFGSDWSPAVTQHVAGFSFTPGSGVELYCVLMTVCKLLTVRSGKNTKNKNQNRKTHAHQERTWISWGFSSVKRNVGLNSFSSASELHFLCSGSRKLLTLQQDQKCSPKKCVGTEVLTQEFLSRFFHFFQAFLVGIVIPDPDTLHNWAKKKGLEGSYQELCRNKVRHNRTVSCSAVTLSSCCLCKHEAIQCISVSTGGKKIHSGGHGENWERIWFEVI